jgi:hypothetical protein
MDKVKALTPLGTHKALEPTLDKINQWYVGWSNYYSLTNYPSQLHKIEAHIRRRLRSNWWVSKRENSIFTEIWSNGAYHENKHQKRPFQITNGGCSQTPEQ